MKKTIHPIAERIEIVRIEMGRTKKQFSQATGISNYLLSKITTHYTDFRISVVLKVLNYYTFISPEWLLQGTGRMYQDGHPEPHELDLLIKTDSPTVLCQKPKQSQYQALNGFKFNFSIN